MFQKMILATVLSVALAGVATAQSSAPGANTGSPSSGTATGSSNPAVKTDGSAPTNKPSIGPRSSLEKGSNSFTEAQAKSRLEEAGITSVSDLKKDDQGIWRGKGTRSGKSVTVGLDYKGNIAAE